MKVSREQMSDNRGRILAQAARLFREKGFDLVSVAEVMKAAGLTHGGFYGHFASKDELIFQVIGQVFSDQQGAVARGFDAFLSTYLSTAHRDAPGEGCPTAAFASDARHQAVDARTAMSDGTRMQLCNLAEAFEKQGVEDPRGTAVGSWSAAVGALILARAVDDPAMSDEILLRTRDWILAGLKA